VSGKRTKKRREKKKKKKGERKKKKTSTIRKAKASSTKLAPLSVWNRLYRQKFLYFSSEKGSSNGGAYDVRFSKGTLV
jgi:hypothetical protein